MIKHFTEIVPYDIAKMLVDQGAVVDCDGIYVKVNAEPEMFALFEHKSCMVDWYKDREYIPAPSYAEVLDWLANNDVEFYEKFFNTIEYTKHELSHMGLRSH